MRPEVTVVMPVWNGEAYLPEAVESILQQTFSDFEFLIIDDGSTDSTPEILKSYAQRDSRIRIIELAHEGIVIALNRGVTEARAPWIARMDCDDIAFPERLERQMDAMHEVPEPALCHTAVELIGDPSFLTPRPRFPRSKALLAARMCFQCPITHPTVLFSKEKFLEAGGYKPCERHAEDFSLWGRMMPLGAFVGVSQPLLKLRLHSDSISKKKADTQAELAQKIALKHCMHFMRLTSTQAARANEALKFARRGNHFKEWFWFLCYGLPRMQWQSFELWAWALNQTCMRSLNKN